MGLDSLWFRVFVEYNIYLSMWIGPAHYNMFVLCSMLCIVVQTLCLGSDVLTTAAISEIEDIWKYLSYLLCDLLMCTFEWKSQFHISKEPEILSISLTHISRTYKIVRRYYGEHITIVNFHSLCSLSPLMPALVVDVICNISFDT